MQTRSVVDKMCASSTWSGIQSVSMISDRGCPDREEAEHNHAAHIYWLFCRGMRSQSKQTMSTSRAPTCTLITTSSMMTCNLDGAIGSSRTSPSSMMPWRMSCSSDTAHEVQDAQYEGSLPASSASSFTWIVKRPQMHTLVLPQPHLLLQHLGTLPIPSLAAVTASVHKVSGCLKAAAFVKAPSFVEGVAANGQLTHICHMIRHFCWK